MQTDRWQQIEELFQAALDLDPNQRVRFLDEACNDRSIRGEVDSLIACHEEAGSFLDATVSNLALAVVARDTQPGPGGSVADYEILSPLGSGGMGQVFRARDAKLGREVAVKILSREFSSNQERVRRFEREARSASALNHPNIITIHEIGHVDSTYYIVMELIQGQTLRDILAAGPLPARKALHIAMQVAEGLAKAHAAGIIHRDLKPDNLMVTRDGLVKILDFGLAKVADVRKGGKDGSAVTEPGRIMGTVGYMSPEQAGGQEVDIQSDQFSLGAIMYEMATGERAFDRATAAETLAAIIRDEPRPIVGLNPGAPGPWRWVIERCLEKDPADRYASTRDLARDLQNIREHLSEEFAAPGLLQPERVGRRERFAWVAAAVCVLLSGVTLAIVRSRTPVETVQPALRFHVAPPRGAIFTALDGPVSVSPNGQLLAFVCTSSEGRKSLWVRSLDSLSARNLTGTEDAYLPFWSPDSRFVGFFAQGKLKRIEASGGPPVTLCDAPIGHGATWSRDGTILFSPADTDTLYSVSQEGGEARPATRIDAAREEKSHRWPSFLPDGRHFLYVVQGAKIGDRHVRIGTLGSEESRPLLGAHSSAVYASPGHLLFVRAGTLMAQSFDLRSLEVEGEPSAVAREVAYDATSLRPEFSVSETGVLAYRNGNYPKTQLTWFDRRGKLLESVGSPGEYRAPALSPDGKRAAVDRVDPQTGTRDVWIIDLLRGAASRFTSDPVHEKDALWSHDGSRIVFVSTRNGRDHLILRPSSGAGGEELLLESAGALYPSDWSSDGRHLLYCHWVPETKWDLWQLPIDGTRKPQPVLRTKFEETEGQFSPNGRWVAYTSNESGAPEVYVQSREEPGAKWTISTSGGGSPRWRRDGKELFYLDGYARLMAVEIKESPAFEAGVPRKLFDARLDTSTPSRSHVVAAHDDRFLISLLVGRRDDPPISVMLDWRNTLRR